MQSPLAKKSIPSKSSSPSNAPTPSTTIALSIPDIVVAILSFLAPAQIRFGASRVCKQWNLLSHGFINNSCTWDSISTKGHEIECAQKLKSARTFQCNYEQWKQSNDSSESRESLIAVISYLTKEEQQRIKRLIVQDLKNDPVDFPIDIFAPLRSLVFLELRSAVVCTFALDTILSMFQNLNGLVLGCTRFELRQESALIREHPDKPWPPSVAKLRALSFRCMTIDFSVLESLLSVCARLKDLGLRLIQQQYPQQYRVNDFHYRPEELPPFDGERFFSALRVNCPLLERFVFSEGHRHLSPENTHALLRAFPSLKGFGLAVSGLVCLLKTASESVPIIEQPTATPFIDHLTSLEIIPCMDATPVAVDNIMYFIFHRILCIAPNLLHLMTWDIPFNTNVIGYNNSYGQDGIWACRNLRTLSLTIKKTGNLAAPGGFPDRGNRLSRMFFAYIVKCCPRLQNIFIRSSDLNLELEGGLCLLSDLRDLENLMIYTTSERVLLQRDLCWLSTIEMRELSVLDRLYRWQILKGIRVDSPEDRAQSTMLQKTLESQGPGPDTELWRAILEASRIEGIREVLGRIQEQQRQGEFCWPKLATLSVSPKNMSVVLKLRPRIRFQESGVW